MKQKTTILVLVMLVVLVAGSAVAYVVIRSHNNDAKAKLKPQDTTTKAPEESNPILSFDKNRYPLDQPDSLWIIVNKKRPLPAEFVPSQLTAIQGSSVKADAAQAMDQLIKAAAGEQVSLRIISGYRSYATQKSVYDAYVKKDGQTAADTYSARPGHSEHQTGLAADLGNGSGKCDLDICFATTTGGTWLAANAHTYGFIIRYTADKVGVTGYQYEPWHIRYVGVDLANELRAKNQTMEEFFGLPAAPGY
jgi:D-alanyl-D-alanine carboxypeptidase